MTEPVTKQTILHSIYQNFFDIVVAVEPANIFAQRIFPSMPDVELNMINSYPIIILESPEVDLSIFSIGKNLTTGTINFNVYTTSAKVRDEIIDKIVYAIESNKGTLATNNIRQIEMDKIQMDQVARGKIKINSCTIPFKFKFWSDKTQAF